ncbi:hypothetical protein ACWGAN_18540 [Streptomyces sp. NPDC054945]
MIIVLDAGRITEQGGYEELVRLDGSFAELVRLSRDRRAVSSGDRRPR